MSSRGIEDRLFVRNGWRHYRRTYSAAEFRWGFVVLAVLAAVVAWVVWKGSHPDPNLYAAAPLEASLAESDDRGPVPGGLVVPGWTEGAISRFDADTLYVKINGRADYFLSFGFERLYFVPLQSEAGVTIDIEIYDLGTAANALGAAAAEGSGSGRNAQFLTRGKHYIRVIGSDESAAVKQQLAHIKQVLEAQMEGARLPEAYGLFGKLGIAGDQIEFKRENAFSFGFAKQVYIARLDEDTVLFLMETEDAEAVAEQFRAAFVKYGSDAGDGWAEDRYLGTFATAIAVDAVVIGVKGAPDKQRGRQEMSVLREVIEESAVEQ